ncbi:hypothetical protein LPJ66_003508 [Kickxella alabastrina]|uniref:Uncharacterized protein n=1 Tax=Kickxella alabastrina TaxID=61397 RepID=A0ACC1INS9_9FUNG|nr:hypothetical protein LPJ66_003508 [Kickxella alabastrina]
MNLNNLKQMESIILDSGPWQLIEKWDKIKESENGKKARIWYHNDLMLMTFGIIGALGFGQTHRCLTSGKTQIVDWVHSAFVLIFLQSIMPFVNGKAHYKDFDKFLALCNSATNIPHLIPPGDATFQGHFIPGGYNLTIGISATNTNPAVWERPYQFYPDRFIDNGPLKRLSLTFSNGVWICPGRNLAWMGIFATLANVFNRYDLELPEDSLFKLDIVDENGLLILMPSTVAITTVPLYPERDTIVVASLRK